MSNLINEMKNFKKQPKPKLLEELFAWAKTTWEVPTVNTGSYKMVFIKNNCAILKYREAWLFMAPQKEHSTELRKRIKKARSQGAKIPAFYADKYYFKDDKKEVLASCIEIHEAVAGKPVAQLLSSNKEAGLANLKSIPQEHYTGLIKTIFLLNHNKIYSEIHTDNILYDKEEGFSIVDLELKERNLDATYVTGTTQTQAILNRFNYYVKDANEMKDRLNAAWDQAEQQVLEICKKEKEEVSKNAIKRNK